MNSISAQFHNKLETLVSKILRKLYKLIIELLNCINFPQSITTMQSYLK